MISKILIEVEGLKCKHQDRNQLIIVVLVNLNIHKN